MNRIIIKKVEDLILFIKQTELPFDTYLEIVQKYIGHGFIWLPHNKDKNELITEIDKFRECIEQRMSVPLFWGELHNPFEEK